MHKLLCLLLVLLLLPVIPAGAEGAALTLTAPAETIRPGKAFLLSFSVPSDGVCDLYLRDAAGQTISLVVRGHAVTAGTNSLWWNGTYEGASAPAGAYQLVLRVGVEEASVPVVIGPHAPYITSITPVRDAENKLMVVNFYASVDGLLTVGLWAGNAWTLLDNINVTAGTTQYIWDASTMPKGTFALTLTLTDATGFSSNEEHIAVSPEEFGIEFPTPVITPAATVVPSDEPIEAATATPTATPSPTPTPEPTPAMVFTPSHGSVYPFEEGEAPSYWNTPMDITDEEAVWAMLSSPFTYLDKSMDTQTRVYAEPNEDSRVIGLVTGKSQGVRVLEEREDGWTLIETYSSTFHDNSIQAWNMLIQGYVPSNLVKTKDMSGKELHIVVDKLTQRAYLFQNGSLKTTLLVSTGVANEEQPYNETRSGDFIYSSPTGGFWSDNMFCPLALKFNDGDLLHEVPYIDRNGKKIYSATEPYLGQRASHGCIRVQRRKTPEGIDMQWLWNNRKKLGRIVVWEDWQGRQIPYPADDTVLYYNAKGGSYYHRGEKCESARDTVVFTPFTYAELDTGSYAKLEYCPYCGPAVRRAELEKINADHAPGGDHDPIMTHARMKYLESLPYEDLKACELRYWVNDATN